MATFYAVVHPQQRMDGTYKVSVRLTHERKHKFLPTGIFVERRQLTRDFRLKDHRVIAKCDEIISRYRAKLLDLDLVFADITVDEIAEYLLIPEGGILFGDWWEQWKKRNQELRGIANYVSAVNSLKQFWALSYRREIRMRDITRALMEDFELYLYDKKRARTQYTAAICKIVRDAMLHYNRPDRTVIPDYLCNYRPPKQQPSRPRALTTGQIRAIFTCPYDGKRNKGVSSRHDLALDVFRLSFMLMGTNAPDLYTAPQYQADVIVYERQKTRNRRADRARIEVTIQEQAKALCDKYRGQTRAFNFTERFSSYQDLARAVNMGLHEVGSELGIDNLTLYTARHSMATIAVNEVGIDKWTVNEMLNHIDESMRVTDIYIRKDFRRINDANRRLLDYVLGKA